MSVTACHRPPTSGAMATSDERIECHSTGTASFARDCTVERMAGKNGLVLTLRHRDGHFRRLAVTQDGHGVTSADGAEPARVTTAGPNAIEVAVGGDRYRLPATVTPGAAPSD